MFNIKLTGDQVYDLVVLLGSANGIFDHLAEEHKAHGLAATAFADNAEKAAQFVKTISAQYNEQGG